VVLRTDDPLASDSLPLLYLARRRWFQLSDGADLVWQAYGNGGQYLDGPVVRTIYECLRAVLWNGAIGLDQSPAPSPDGLLGSTFAGETRIDQTVVFHGLLVR
jgi:hypothetical protein